MKTPSTKDVETAASPVRPEFERGVTWVRPPWLSGDWVRVFGSRYSLLFVVWLLCSHGRKTLNVRIISSTPGRQNPKSVGRAVVTAWGQVKTAARVSLLSGNHGAHRGLQRWSRGRSFTSALLQARWETLHLSHLFPCQVAGFSSCLKGGSRDRSSQHLVFLLF